MNRAPNFLTRIRQGVDYILTGGKTLATTVSSWQEGKPVYSNTRFETLVKEGWRQNELIHACIGKTANTAAQVQVQLIDRSEEPLEAHPLLDLLRKPNPYMSEFDFWSSVIIFQKLAGIAYYEKVRSALGNVVELWPLRPDWLHPIASSKEFISGYEYKVPGERPVPIKAADVLRFPLWDPLNAYQGTAPVAVAARVGDVDNSATDYLKLFFEKGGTPPGILSTKQMLSSDKVTEIRAKWRDRYGGVMGWLDPVVLDYDAQYQQIGSSFKDMGFDVLDARNEARICAVLQVPPILVGAKIGLDRSTYSNYAEARRAWWQDDLLPMYYNFQDVLDNGLAKEWGDDLRVEWDLSGVYALMEDVASMRQQATAALAGGGITVNEYREWLELEPVGPSGDVFVRSTSTVEVPKDGERTALEEGNDAPDTAQPRDVGEEAPENLDSTVGLNGAQISAALEILVGVTEGIISRVAAIELLISMGISRDQAERIVGTTEIQPSKPKPDDDEVEDDEDEGKPGAKARNAPDDDARRKHERVVEEAMREYFEAQQARAVKDASNGR